MTVMSFLLVLLTGAVVGWLIRKWFSRKELAAHHRNQQLQRLDPSRGPGNSNALTEQSAEDDPESMKAAIQYAEEVEALSTRLEHAEDANGDLTQSLALKDNEVDELYQVASRIKPLEYELHRAQAENRRLEKLLKKAKEFAKSENALHIAESAKSDAALADDATQKISFLETQLAEAQRDLENFRNDQTLGFAALQPDDAASENQRREEIDELYREVSRIKPLELQLEQKNAELRDLKESVSDRQSDQIRQLNAELADLKSANSDLLDQRQRSDTSLLEVRSDLDESQQELKNLALRADDERNGLSTRIDDLQEKVRVRDLDIEALQQRISRSAGIEQELGKLQSEVESSREINAQLLESEGKVKDFDATLVRLGSVESELATSVQSNEALQESLQQYRGKNKQLADELQVGEEDLLATKSRLQILQQQQKQSEKALGVAEQRIKSSESQIARLSTESQSLADQNQQLSAQLQSVSELQETEKQKSLTTLKKNVDELNQVNRQLESSRRDNASTRQSLDDAGKQLVEKQQALDSVNQQLGQLQAEHADKVKELESQSAQMTGLQSDKQKLETDYKNVHQQLDSSAQKLSTTATELTEVSALSTRQAEQLQQQEEGLLQSRKQTDEARRNLKELELQSAQDLKNLQISEQTLEKSLEDKNQKLAALARQYEAAKGFENDLASSEGRNKQLKLENESVAERVSVLESELLREKQQFKEQLEHHASSKLAFSELELSYRKLSMQSSVAVKQSRQIPDLQTQISDEKALVLQRSEQLEAKQKDLQDLRGLYQNMEKKLVEKDERLKILAAAEEQASSYAEQIKQQGKDLELANQKHDALEQSLQKKSEQSAALSTELKDKTSRLSGLQEQLSLAGKKAEQDQKSLSSVRSQFSDLRAQHERLRTQHVELEQTESSQRIALEKSNENSAELQARLSAQGASRDKLQQQVEGIPILQKSVEAFQRENSELKLEANRIGGLSATIEERDAEILKLRQQEEKFAQRMELGLRQKDEEISVLERKLVARVELEKKLEYTQTQLQTAEHKLDQIPALQATLSERNQLVVKLNAEAEALSKKIHLEKQEKDRQEQQLVEMRKQVAEHVEVKKQAETLTDQLQKAKLEIQAKVSLQQELQQSVEKADALKKENLRLASEMEKLAGVEAKLSSQASKFDLLEQHLSKNQARINQLETEKLATLKSVTELKASNGSGRNQIEKLEQELEVLRVKAEGAGSLKSQLEHMANRVKDAEQEAKHREKLISEQSLATKTTLEKQLADVQAALDLASRKADVAAGQRKELELSLVNRDMQANETQGLIGRIRQEKLQLETSLQSNNEELQQLRQQNGERERSLKALRADAERAGALESRVKVLMEQVREIKVANDKVASMEAQLVTSQQSLLQTQKQLKDKDEDLSKLSGIESQYASAADNLEKAEKRVKQLQSLEPELESKARQLAELSDRVRENEHSLKQMDDLKARLSQAEKEARENSESDLELRRMRSELESLGISRAASLEKAASLQEQVESEKSALKQSQAEIRKLQRLRVDVEKRDKRIASLEVRLQELTQKAKITRKKTSAKPKTETVAKAVSSAAGAGNSRKSAAPKEKVMFKAPKEKDDLKKVYGIGPVMEKTLYKLGITSYQQIANFKKADIARVAEAIETFPDRIDRDDWVGGAKKCYRDKYKSKA